MEQANLGIGMKIQTEEPGGGSEGDPQTLQANKLFQTGVLLVYGPRKSIDRAIKCIQKAITINDSNYKYWQILGEAYYQRGSLNPAINCFMKSLKLAESDDSTISEDDETERERKAADCVYSRLRMSDIRLSVGHLDEAAKGYSDIIENEPNNVAALIGFSKTHLQMAKNNFSSSLVKVGHSHCMIALEHTLKAIKLSPHLCLTWKLASDCCLMQFVHGQTDNFVTKINVVFPGSDNDILVINRESCIKLATQFLCKALDISPFQESGCLWHNLGICLYLNSKLTQDDKARDFLLKRSLKCLLKAFNYDRNSSQIKNSIGVVAFHLNLLDSAQTFLIKSIQTNMSTSEIQFSNLGYMYLQKGEYRLASTAFNRCQAEEPLYARSWLGNALINKQNNLDTLSNLRHCHKLESNYHSQLMFATKVSSLPNKEEHKRDLINALDCMERLINYDRHSLEANNTLGLLYEKNDHLDKARIYFDNAYAISEQDSRVIFNKLRQYRASKSCFDMDGGIYDQYINFIKSTEKLTNAGNREYLLNYIYYLFNNGDYKNVNTKITKFMEKLPQNELSGKINAQILLGLAAEAEGSDFKSWLFKNIIDLDNKVCLESNINLLSMMLLGAISKDDQLVEQVSQDLSKHFLAFIASKSMQFNDLFYSNDGYWLRFCILVSIFSLKDQSKFIKPLVALFPTIPELWLYLGLTYMFQKTKLHAAIFCLTKVETIGSGNPDLGFICDLLFIILTQAIKLKENSLNMRQRHLLKAIVKYPDYGLLWKSLMTTETTDLANKVKKNNQYFKDEDSDLFNLAIDHTLKMCRIYC